MSTTVSRTDTWISCQFAVKKFAAPEDDLVVQKMVPVGQIKNTGKIIALFAALGLAIDGDTVDMGDPGPNDWIKKDICVHGFGKGCCLIRLNIEEKEIRTILVEKI